jgi:hypothetical protein
MLKMLEPAVGIEPTTGGLQIPGQVCIEAGAEAGATSLTASRGRQGHAIFASSPLLCIRVRRMRLVNERV